MPVFSSPDSGAVFWGSKILREGRKNGKTTRRPVAEDEVDIRYRERKMWMKTWWHSCLEEFCVVGSLLTAKSFNAEAWRATLYNMWKLESSKGSKDMRAGNDELILVHIQWLDGKLEGQTGRTFVLRQESSALAWFDIHAQSRQMTEDSFWVQIYNLSPKEYGEAAFNKYMINI